MLIAANAKSSTHQHNNKKQHHIFSLTARITTIVVIEKNHKKIKICYKEQNILQYNINQVKGSKRSSKKKKKNYRARFIKCKLLKKTRIILVGKINPFLRCHCNWDPELQLGGLSFFERQRKQKKKKRKNTKSKNSKSYNLSSSLNLQILVLLLLIDSSAAIV